MNKTKRAIFDSAIKVFSKSGYNGATMDAIAADAGVAKGTLYYYFKSKEEIFKYIIEEGMNFIKEKIEDMAKTEQDALSKIKIMCKIQLGLVYEKKDFFKVIMGQLWGQELRHIDIREAVRKYISYVTLYLEDAMDEGVIIKGDSSFMAYTLFGTICSAAVYDLINNDDNNPEDLMENLIKYILDGIMIKNQSITSNLNNKLTF